MDETRWVDEVRRGPPLPKSGLLRAARYASYDDVARENHTTQTIGVDICILYLSKN